MLLRGAFHLSVCRERRTELSAESEEVACALGDLTVTESDRQDP